MASDGYVPIVRDVYDVPSANAEYTQLNFEVTKDDGPIRPDQDQIWVFFLTQSQFNSFEKQVDAADNMEQLKAQYPGRFRQILWTDALQNRPTNGGVAAMYSFSVHIGKCQGWSEQPYGVYVTVLEPGSEGHKDVLDVARMGNF